MSVGRCGPQPVPERTRPGEGIHLELRDVGLWRNNGWLFRHVNLSVPRGSFVAVLGPSGVGKSSFLSCLAGMLSPTEGEITYQCKSNCLHNPGSFQKQIGIVFQNLMLTSNSSLLKNVLCGRLGRYSWWKTALAFPRGDKVEAYHVLYDLGLANLVHRVAGEVSGGEQQRTAIARALFQQPEIILADEPVSNLDSYLTGRVLGILKQHAHTQSRTVLCVLHNQELVSRFADYAFSLNPCDPERWVFHPVQPVVARA
jgi:phosphonate transport system ATP-binding protein